MDYPAQRRERLARLLPEEGLDAILVSSPVNVTYLTGFTGDSSVLVLSRDRAVLVSDPRYTGQIAEAGGALTAADGGPFDPFRPDICATNGHLQQELLGVLNG